MIRRVSVPVVLAVLSLIQGSQAADVELGLTKAAPFSEVKRNRKDASGSITDYIYELKADGWTGSGIKMGEGSNIGTDPDLPAAYREVLGEYGIDGFVTRSFQRGQRRVYISVYEFPNSSGAFGAYTVMRKGASTVLTRGGASSEDDQSISFWKHRFFVQVYTTAEDDDEAKELVTRLADRIDKSIAAASSLPAVLASLPRLDLIEGSEKFFLGPVSAKRVSNFPYLSLLDIANSSGACSADYRVHNPRPERLKLFIVEYKAPQKAYSIFKEYAGALEHEHKGEVSAGTALFKLGRSYLYCRINGNRVAIISGAKKRLSSMILARQLGN